MDEKLVGERVLPTGGLYTLGVEPGRISRVHPALHLGQSQRMTKECFLDYAKSHMEFSNIVRGVALKMAKARNATYYDPAESYRGFEVEVKKNGEYEITVEFNEFYRGDNNYFNFVIPNEYFWMTEDVEKVESERQAAFLAKQARLAEEKKAAEELERLFFFLLP